jgi:hypothetical protein
MDKHTNQQIKLKMREQHMTLCYEYKNATLFDTPPTPQGTQMWAQV